MDASRIMAINKGPIPLLQALRPVQPAHALREDDHRLFLAVRHSVYN